MELKYGGGALEDYEAEEWQYVVNRELRRLTLEVRKRIIDLDGEAGGEAQPPDPTHTPEENPRTR